MKSKIKNSFTAKVNRSRSLNTLKVLLSMATSGASNPKTIRRRRRLVKDKLASLSV
jgi:hypothetical protein